MRCLIVEDDQLVAERWRQVLGDLGMETTLAYSQAEGERSLNSERFGLMLADLGLPDGDGLDLIALAATRDPSLPVVVVSGRTNLALSDLFSRNDNVTAFFQKSENFEEVAALVDHYRLRSASPGATTTQTPRPISATSPWSSPWSPPP